jgi:hypothetical protein
LSTIIGITDLLVQINVLIKYMKQCSGEKNGTGYEFH